MARFEKITKIDGYEVTLITSYNNMEVYKNTGDNGALWLVVQGQVVFSFYEERGEMQVSEEYREV